MCCEARGLGPEDKIEGVLDGSLDLHGQWTVEAEHILIY
jgi:hypothetical protein